MKGSVIVVVALICLTISLSSLNGADRAADEPVTLPDPRPTDLTTGRKGTRDEPVVRSDPRARDLTTGGKTAVGRSTLEVSGLTAEQSDRIRAIRQRAADDIQTIRDRERVEIMAVLTEQQRVEYLRAEEKLKLDGPRRATTLPATTQNAP